MHSLFAMALRVCFLLFEALRGHLKLQLEVRRMSIPDFGSLFQRGIVKTLSHGAIFLTTCNAILRLGDVKLANTCFHHSLPIYF